MIEVNIKKTVENLIDTRKEALEIASNEIKR